MTVCECARFCTHEGLGLADKEPIKTNKNKQNEILAFSRFVSPSLLCIILVSSSHILVNPINIPGV